MDKEKPRKCECGRMLKKPKKNGKGKCDRCHRRGLKWSKVHKL